MSNRKLTVSLPRLLTPAEVAEYLGISEKTLANERSAGIGFRYTTPRPRLIRYFADDILKCLEENTQETI